MGSRGKGVAPKEVLKKQKTCVSIGVCVIRTPLGGDPCDCIVHVIFGVPLNYSDECVHYFFAWELIFFKQKKYVFLPQNIDLSLSGVKCSRIFVILQVCLEDGKGHQINNSDYGGKTRLF